MSFYEYCKEQYSELDWDLAQIDKEEKEYFEKYIGKSSDIVQGINPYTNNKQYLTYPQCDNQNMITGMIHKNGEKLIQGYNMFEENIEIIDGYIEKEKIKELYELIISDISFQELSIQPLEN